MPTYNIELAGSIGDEVSFEGIGWGYGVRPILHHRARDIVVIKIPGGSDWSSIGSTSYRGAEFMVGRIVEGEIPRVTIEPIISFPVRMGGKQ